MSIPDDQIWLIVLGFIIAFILAFGIGANDVANSFGTSVGSRVLTLRQACILATIFETLGAVLIGAKVSDTIRKGVLLKDVFDNVTENNGTKCMMAGQLASLSGAGICLLVATFLKLPVSGSHSIIGAMMGFVVVVIGFKGINWKTLGLIVSSWCISPILSGAVSLLAFFIVDRFILQKAHPLEPGLTLLPYIYAMAIVINVFSILVSGPPLLKFHLIPLYGVFVISIAAAIITILVVRFILVPYLRTKITQMSASSTRKASTVVFPLALGSNLADVEQLDFMPSTNINPDTATSKLSRLTFDKVQRRKESRALIKDKVEQDAMFSWVQILTAIFGSFAHGGNDVSNAIGPLVGLWIIGITQDLKSSMETPIWILVYGSLGICVGLWVWGRRVINTVGDELTKITPASGVCIELGAAMTVLLASNIGIPVSTTHCKIGSIVAVGRYRMKENVDWSIFLNIVIAWLVTVPVSAALGALFMYGFTFVI